MNLSDIPTVMQVFKWWHNKKIQHLRSILLARARNLNPNAQWLTRAQWSVFLKNDCNLIDEVLESLYKDQMAQANPFGGWKLGPKSIY